MAEDFGSGVSRTLSALKRQFAGVVWQKGRPPLDSELNLMGQVDLERLREFVRANMHSGFLLDPTQADKDYETDPAWSNFFKLGRAASESDEDAVLWANVNGWLVPVTGTAVTDASNKITLNPPPDSDTRVDFVFLEAWVASVGPNPSTTNKPSADKVWKWGNVEFGGTNIDDDIEDPTIGYETTERLQVQYRIRVYGKGQGLGETASLDDYPEGLGDPSILGQGTSSSTVAGFAFANMADALGDPGLWRAGDGDSTNGLGTFDGYTYAIPICAVFRRNSGVFVARENAGNANQNGGFDRNPSAALLADPREGAKVLASPTLAAAITEATTGTIQVTDLAGSGFDDPEHALSSVFMVIDNEIIGIGSVDASASPATITIPASGRGRYGTMAVPHAAGAEIKFFNSRPDGLFSDQVSDRDILDMRHGVTAGDWDYQRLLLHNFAKLVQGELRSTWKVAGIGDTQGPSVVEVDTLLADGATTVPNQTEALDGPDGIRTIFSDAATIQPDVTLMLQPQGTNAVTAFSTGVTWTAGPDFTPHGFMVDASNWTNNAVVFLDIGGSSGSDGARSTFRDGSERAVRFISPREFWKSSEDLTEVGAQHPFTMRFIQQPSMQPAAGSESSTEHPGPMYPLKEYNFEKPFIVLGGALNADVTQSAISGVTLHNDSPSAGEYEIDLAGLDFDTDGDWYTKSGGDFVNDPGQINKPVLGGRRTLYDMLTAGGTDLTGASSEVYLVLWGDGTNPENNGCFRVIGAGATAGYTTKAASAADRVRVEFIGPTGGPSAFALPSSGTLKAELRSQYINAEDGEGFSSDQASVAVVITDIQGITGGSANPWNSANLGSLALPNPVPGYMALRTTLQYHPGRSGMARIPDRIWRVGVVGAGSEYLRQSPTSLDSNFSSDAGVSSSETYFDIAHIHTWNRLPSLGLDAPHAPSYGGITTALAEQDREHEVFIDNGSKTLVFRPFQDKRLTLYKHTITSGTLIPSAYPAGHGGFNVDGANLFVATLTAGYPVPPEYMPRFGRQDIPFHVDLTGSGSGTFLQGINHLFTDSTDATEDQFNVVGGVPGAGVQSLFIHTGATSGLAYGQYGTVAGTAVSGYQGRLYEDTQVVSSDLGRGLRGIQLPPFLGIARLYGVYDRRDFESAGGATFETDRITASAGAPPNLLRKDASKQTLFILQGGASDVTGNANDHTYIVPEDAIDIRLSNAYSAGETFEDIEYVVECVVFGFARGFINQNNYVLARDANGSGGSAATVLDDCHMTIPAAAPRNDQMYVMYSRIPYQGDPFMTRAGGSRTTTDYAHRYGQVTQANAFNLSSPIQQFDSDGNLLIETPNKRPLEVLASIDFYTTMGTGKIGGPVLAGTPLDVGHVEATREASLRVPAASTQVRWRVVPRTFTAGQISNTSHASATAVVLDNASMTGVVFSVTKLDKTTVSFTAGTSYAVGANPAATATNLAAAINASASLRGAVKAETNGAAAISVIAVSSGAVGNRIRVGTTNAAALAIRVPGSEYPLSNRTHGYLSGGVDVPVNAGSGESPLSLTGMTERLPLGILLQDSDFLCEDPMRDGASLMASVSGGVRPVQALLPSKDAREYTRLVGGPGQWVGMADGSILEYAGYDAASAPTGTKKFRLYRGGGSAFVLAGENPGGPVDWVAGAFSAEMKPVLKGGVLVGKAMLVRNFAETAFSANDTVSHGDEVQMVVLTRGILGDGQGAKIGLTGTLSPTGYGEGYAAADRYRIEGHPLVSGRTRKAVSVDVDFASFPYSDLTVNAER